MRSKTTWYMYGIFSQKRTSAYVNNSDKEHLPFKKKKLTRLMKKKKKEEENQDKKTGNTDTKETDG